MPTAVEHCLVVILLATGALLAPEGSIASVDLPGAEDPVGLQRFGRSWIVDYSHESELLTREFIISRVDKTRRDVRAEKKIRTEARQTAATYRIPDGTPREEVVDHYVGLLGGESLFSCQGRDCGRSNHWANHIFRRAMLYGPDTQQFYLAAEHEGYLISVYVIERGNKRVYAHVRALDAEQPLAGSGGKVQDGLTDQLIRTGYAVIQGVTPLANGRLSAEAGGVLGDWGDRLRRLSGQQVYVVCHIDGVGEVNKLLEVAKACSGRAVELLSTDGGPDLIPFAAGPMLPRATHSSRIELVIPPHLRNE